MVNAVQDEGSNSANVNFIIEDIFITLSGLIKFITSEGVTFMSRPAYFENDSLSRLEDYCKNKLPEDLSSCLFYALRRYEAECEAVVYLNRAEHSRFQLELKLIKRGFFNIEVDPALDYLETKGLLNDERFARAWLHSRVIRRFEGRQRLASELLSRGIDFQVINIILNEYFAENPEKELCRKALLKQQKKSLDAQKIMRSMQRLGFSAKLVNICLEGE